MLGFNPAPGFNRVNPAPRNGPIRSVSAADNVGADMRRGDRAPGVTVTLISVEPMYTSAAEIQADLNNNGFVKLQSGTIDIDTTITLRFGQTLRGDSQGGTILNYTGAGSWCIQFGVVGQSNYGCYLEDLTVHGGGVHIQQMGQHCAITNVTARSGPSHGFYFNAAASYIGERLVMKGCHGTDNRGSGLAMVVGSGGSIHGVDVVDCLFDYNDSYGGLFETVTDTGTLLLVQVKGTTFRENCQGDIATAEVYIHGYANLLNFVDVDIETLDTKVITGLWAGRRTFTATRYPSYMYLKNVSIDCGDDAGVNPNPRAIDFDYAYAATFEGITLVQDAANIYYRSLGDNYVPINVNPELPAGSRIVVY